MFHECYVLVMRVGEDLLKRVASIVVLPRTVKGGGGRRG